MKERLKKCRNQKHKTKTLKHKREGVGDLAGPGLGGAIGFPKTPWLLTWQ